MDAWKANDFEAIGGIYADDAVYYEPYNPPHNGNLLTVAYLKDFLGSKTELEVTVKRLVEAEDERTVAAEWSFSYTAAGRRWNKLPRASFVELNDEGRITYHRDYS
jgi:ketosteroid isomerase-like protein